MVALTYLCGWKVYISVFLSLCGLRSVAVIVNGLIAEYGCSELLALKSCFLKPEFGNQCNVIPASEPFQI